MESSEKSEQFSFKEIDTVLAEKHLRSDQEGIPSKIILKLSSDSAGFQFWVWMLPNCKKLKLTDSQRIAIRLEPILLGSSENNVFVFSIPELEPEMPEKIIKRNRRKPGPNLRAH